MLWITGMQIKSDTHANVSQSHLKAKSILLIQILDFSLLCLISISSSFFPCDAEKERESGPLRKIINARMFSRIQLLSRFLLKIYNQEAQKSFITLYSVRARCWVIRQTDRQALLIPWGILSCYSRPGITIESSCSSLLFASSVFYFSLVWCIYIYIPMKLPHVPRQC